MNGYIKEDGRYATHYTHIGRAITAKRERGKVISIRPSAVRILGIDTGQKCGFATLNAEDWDSDIPQIDHFAYIDVSDEELFPGHIEKIRRVGQALREVIERMDPIAMGIEVPVIARAANVTTIMQARMLQHLIDVSGALYHVGFSEINPATSRAQVLIRGDYKKGKTKGNVVKRVETRFGISFRGLAELKTEQREREQAMADAVTVALAFMRATRKP